MKAQLRRHATDIRTEADKFRKLAASASLNPEVRFSSPHMERSAPAAPRARPLADAQGAILSSAERKILTALAQYPGGRTKTQIAILTGYAHSGGGFNNALSALRTKGFIGRGDPIGITDAGLAALGSWEPLPAGDALLAHWLKQLSLAERTVLDVLVSAYPRSLTKDEIAAQAGYAPSGGGFNNALSRLRTLELVSGYGEIRASENLFG